MNKKLICFIVTIMFLISLLLTGCNSIDSKKIKGEIKKAEKKEVIKKNKKKEEKVKSLNNDEQLAKDIDNMEGILLMFMYYVDADVQEENLPIVENGSKTLYTADMTLENVWTLIRLFISNDTYFEDSHLNNSCQKIEHDGTYTVILSSSQVKDLLSTLYVDYNNIPQTQQEIDGITYNSDNDTYSIEFFGEIGHQHDREIRSIVNKGDTVEVEIVEVVNGGTQGDGYVAGDDITSNKFVLKPIANKESGFKYNIVSITRTDIIK